MKVCEMSIPVGIWPCQLLEQMKHPLLSWNILVARRSCCSTKMNDSTVICAKQNVALSENQGITWSLFAMRMCGVPALVRPLNERSLEICLGKV